MPSRLSVFKPYICKLASMGEFPGARQIVGAHLTRLKSLLHDASKGRYGRDMTVEVPRAARNSIGSQDACQVFGIAAYHPPYP